MANSFKDTIRSNDTLLTDNLKNVDTVIYALFEKKAITAAEKNDLTSIEKTARKRTKDLFILLQTKPDDIIFESVLPVLRSDGNQICAAILDGTCSDEQMEQAKVQSKNRIEADRVDNTNLACTICASCVTHCTIT